MIFYVSTSDLALQKPEFEKMIREFVCFTNGRDKGLLQFITLRITATHVALVLMLSYLAACFTIKLHVC